MKNTIEINGRPHPIKFGYGAIRALGAYLNTPGYDTTIVKVNELLQRLTTAEKDGEGIPFEITDALGYLLLAGLDHADPDNGFGHDEVCDIVLLNPELLKPVFEVFMASMPKAKEQKKSPPKKRTAPKK